MSDEATKTVKDVFGQDCSQGLEPTHYFDEKTGRILSVEKEPAK